VVDRIAQILALQGDSDPVDVRGSKALGIQANPARALELLASCRPPHCTSTSAKLRWPVAPEWRAWRGSAPITIRQVREVLGHCNVTVKPVVDLAGGMPVDCYEIPARMHEIVKLRSPFEVFPWGTGSSRSGHDDHSDRYILPTKADHPDRPTRTISAHSIGDITA